MSQSVPEDTLTWDWRPAHSRLTRYCLYFSVAPLLGLLLGGALLMLTLLPGLAANPELLAVVAVFALVGGPFSLLYLWPVLTDADQRPGPIGVSWLGALHPLGVAVAAVGGLAAVVASLRVADYGLLVLFGGCMGLGLPATGLLATRGRIEPETLTLRFEWAQSRGGGLIIEMRNWTGLRRVRFGPVVVCLASYVPGTGGGSPRLFVLPASVASAATDSLDRALAVSADTPARERNAAVAVTLAAFGVGILPVGVGLWWLVDLPTGIALWLSGLCATFGLLFLALAARER